MKIDNYGVGKRYSAAMQELMAFAEREECPYRRLILLPIPTTKDGVNLSGGSLPISELLRGIGKGDLVCGYGISPFFEKITEYGADYYDASLDEEFLTENAILTADGALGVLLTERERSPMDEACGIVGYGRIGKALLHRLAFLGANVRVYTSKKLTRVELGSCEIKTVEVESYGEPLDFSGLDLLINTAPASLSESFPKGKPPRGLSVYELASGDNFRGVEGVKKLPSLPGKMYPISAGKAYARGIIRHIRGTEL